MKAIRRYLPIILLTAGAAMIAIGVFVTKEPVIVLRKAIKICMECIGIG